MVLIVKKKIVLLITLLVTLAALVAGVFALPVFAPAHSAVIVLDAGHGGVDKGATGCGLNEAEINLDIIKKTAALLEKQGYRVILTRKDEEGLYGSPTEGFKRRDMAERKRIILETKPDIVVSVHCNKFPAAPARRGAQVFFNEFSQEGKRLAGGLQGALNDINRKQLGRAYVALSADYYMLNCSPYPSALVECGFLSNADDAALLATTAHREALAYSIFSGINAFFANQVSGLV